MLKNHTSICVPGAMQFVFAEFVSYIYVSIRLCILCEFSFVCGCLGARHARIRVPSPSYGISCCPLLDVALAATDPFRRRRAHIQENAKSWRMPHPGECHILAAAKCWTLPNPGKRHMCICTRMYLLTYLCLCVCVHTHTGVCTHTRAQTLCTHPFFFRTSIPCQSLPALPEPLHDLTRFRLGEPFSTHAYTKNSRMILEGNSSVVDVSLILCLPVVREKASKGERSTVARIAHNLYECMHASVWVCACVVSACLWLRLKLTSMGGKSTVTAFQCGRQPALHACTGCPGTDRICISHVSAFCFPTSLRDRCGRSPFCDRIISWYVDETLYFVPHSFPARCPN